jgi:prepilin-type N-terminal cleavage/methylation domain-containing protein
MRRSAGFTLIEVLVALTIGSLVVLMVHESFGGAMDLAARLDAERQAHAAHMEAHAFLTRAFGSLEIGTPGTHGFEGLPDRMRFSTVLDTQMPEDVTVRLVDGQLVAERGTVVARTIDSATAIAFDYLLSYGSTASWVQEWHSPASAPLAARLRLLHPDGAIDTLLFIIGPRG